MKYKAILFDMNGVLVDDEVLQEQAFRQTLSKINLSLTSNDYTRFFIGKTDRKGFEDYLHNRYTPQNIDSLIEQKGKEYQKLASDSIRGYPGTKKFVEAAIHQGFSLALVTSSMKSEATAALNGLNLASYFTSVVTTEDVTYSKPHPEGYLKGAALLGTDPHDCIVIEDAPSGLEAARSAGMFSVAVLNTHTKDALSDADIITDKLSMELIDRLAQL